MARPAHRRKRNRRLRSALLCTAAALLCMAAAFAFLPRPTPPAVQAGPASPVSAPEESSSLPEEPESAAAPSSSAAPDPVVTAVQGAAAGDNLLHDGLYLQAARRAQRESRSGYDFTALYEHVFPLFSGSDLNLINAETLFSDELEPSAYPRFCSPGDAGRALYDMGFNVFFLANNHIYDKGAEGLASTMRFWDSMPQDIAVSGLSPAGEEAPVPMLEKDGVRFACLAFTEMTNGLPTPSGAAYHVTLLSDEEEVRDQIERARRQADFVIVSAHWGTENTHTVSQSQRAWAQKLADWGADLILGTHPHVVQPIETVTSADGRTVPVAYSLGNFVSAQIPLDNLVGIVLRFTAEKTEWPDGRTETEIRDLSAVPVVMHYDANFANLRLYPFSSYTEELAASHGTGGVTLAAIESILKENIAPEYLAPG